MKSNLLDLNDVTLKQLSSIPGIDEKFAKAVLKYRNQHKGVRHFDELWKINGISRPKYKILKRHVEVVGQEPLVVGSKLPYAKESLETVNALTYQGFQKQRTELQKRSKSANVPTRKRKVFTSTPKAPRPSSYHYQIRNTFSEENTPEQTKPAFVSPVAELNLPPTLTMSKRRPYNIEASPSGNKVCVTCNLNKCNKDKDSWMLLNLETGKGQRKTDTDFASPVNEATSTTRVQFVHTQTQTPRETINEIAKSVQQSYFKRTTKQNISSAFSSVRNGTVIHPPGIQLHRKVANTSQYQGDNIGMTHIPTEIYNKDRDRLINDTRDRLKNAKKDLRIVREVHSPRRLSEGILHEFEVQTYKTLGQKVRSIEQWIDEVEKETRGMYSKPYSGSSSSNSSHSVEKISKLVYPNVKSTNKEHTLAPPIYENQCISCQQPTTSNVLSPDEANESHGLLRREDLTTSGLRTLMMKEEDNRPMHKRKPQERIKKDNDREMSPSPKSQKTAHSPRSQRSGKEKQESRSRYRRHRSSHRRHSAKKTRPEDACKVM